MAPQEIVRGPGGGTWRSAYEQAERSLAQFPPHRLRHAAIALVAACSLLGAVAVSAWRSSSDFATAPQVSLNWVRSLQFFPRLPQMSRALRWASSAEVRFHAIPSAPWSPNAP